MPEHLYCTSEAKERKLGCPTGGVHDVYLTEGKRIDLKRNRLRQVTSGQFLRFGFNPLLAGRLFVYLESLVEFYPRLLPCQAFPFQLGEGSPSLSLPKINSVMAGFSGNSQLSIALKPQEEDE